MKNEARAPRSTASAGRLPSGVARIPRPPLSMRPVWSAGVARGPRVLLVLRGQDRPTQSLLYAVAVARSYDARLHVLAVVPGATGLGNWLRDDVTIGRRAAVQTRDTRKALCSWLAEILDTRRAIEHAAVCYGDFVAQSAVYAATIEAKLILVPGDDRMPGGDITSLSKAAATPVLVARGTQGPAKILAATDLLSPSYPVLTHAADLGRRVNGTVVAIHNVTPEPIAGAEVALKGYSLSLQNPQIVRAERLAEVARSIPSVTHTVVRSEHSPAHAVVNEARARAADLVVVGTRWRAGLERVWHGSVSDMIVKNASCSVLVLPLDTPELASGSALD